MSFAVQPTTMSRSLRLVPTLDELRVWGTLELILYLSDMYYRELHEDVYHTLRSNRVSGGWFLYLREVDYTGWGFTRKEAKILEHEARLIEGGDYVRASREEYLTGLRMGIGSCLFGCAGLGSDCGSRD